MTENDISLSFSCKFLYTQSEFLNIMFKGAQLGKSQLKIALAHLINNFEVRVAPRMKNKAIKMDPNNYMMSMR